MRKRIGATFIFIMLLLFVFSSITVFGKLKKNIGHGYDLLVVSEDDVVYNSNGNDTVLLKGKAKTKKGSYTYRLNNGKLRIEDSVGKVVFEKDKVKQVLAGKEDCYYIEIDKKVLYFDRLGRFNLSSKKDKYIIKFDEPDIISLNFGVPFEDKVRYFGNNVFYLNWASGDGGFLSCVDFRTDKHSDGIGFYGSNPMIYENRIYVAGASFNEKGDYKSILMASYNLDFADRKEIIMKESKGKKFDPYYGMTLKKIDKKYIYVYDYNSKKTYKYSYECR